MLQKALFIGCYDAPYLYTVYDYRGGDLEPCSTFISGKLLEKIFDCLAERRFCKTIHVSKTTKDSYNRLLKRLYSEKEFIELFDQYDFIVCCDNAIFGLFTKEPKYL